jgi:hypothetical protein
LEAATLKTKKCFTDSLCFFHFLQGIRTRHSNWQQAEGVFQHRAITALRAALVPVNMCALAPQLLQPSFHLPSNVLPQLLMHVIGSNSALTSLHLAVLSLPIETLPLLASAWQQLAMPPIILGISAAEWTRLLGGHGRWLDNCHASGGCVVREARMQMPRTLRWTPFQGAGAPEVLVKIKQICFRLQWRGVLI